MHNQLPSLTIAQEISSHQPIVWDAASRLRHLYVLGKSGTGKSTLLAHLVKQDIEHGSGVLVLDPHGDMIEMAERELGKLANTVTIVRLTDAQTAEALIAAIDVTAVLNRGQAILVSIGKGHIGEELAVRLGHDLLARFVTAMLERRGQDIKQPCAVYLEEAPNWWQKDLEPLLVSGRSCGVSVVLAHQYLAQFDEETRDLILGNVATMVFFAIGMYDAEQLEPEVAPRFTKDALIDQPAFRVIVSTVAGARVQGDIKPPILA